MSEHRATSLVRRFTEEVWNERRLDLLDELVGEAYELRNLSDDSIPVRGRAELRHHVEEWLAAFPDLHMQETDHLAAGSRVASVVRIRGTHTGQPFQGVPAAGAEIDVALVAVFDCDGGQLVGHSTLLDARRLLEQLAG